MFADYKTKTAYSTNVATGDYPTFQDLQESATIKTGIRSADLMLLARHIEKTFYGINSIDRDYEGAVWFQLFGEYDLDRAQNLWSIATISNECETKLICADSKISGSLAPISVEEPNDLTLTEKMDLEKKIVSFRNLDDGWDSYNAPKIDEVAMDKSLNLVNSLFASIKRQKFKKTSFFAAPLYTGGIQIEIDSENVLIEIEVEPGNEGRVFYYVRWSGKQVLRGYRGGPYLGADEVTQVLLHS